MHQPAKLGANKGLAITQALVVTLLCHFLAPPVAAVTVCLTGCDYSSIGEAATYSPAGSVIMIEPQPYNELAVNITRALTFSVMNSGVAVINGVGKWLSIRGVTLSTTGTFQLNNASVEVVAGGTWDQVGDVSLVVPPTALAELVGVTLDNATWEQRGDFDCTFQQWSGVSLKGDHATWQQHGQAIFTSTNAGYVSRAGIAIGALKTALWNQEGSVTFNMQNEQFSGRCIEVTVMQNASFRWAQLGDVTIAATGIGPGSIGGIQFDAFVPFGELEWVQEGSVTMDITVVEGQAVGIWLGPQPPGGEAYWNQTGDVSINITTSNAFPTRGCIVANSMWDQKGDMTVTLRGAGSSQLRGIVTEDYLNWVQHGDLSVLLSDTTSASSSLLAVSYEGGQWLSYGQVGLTTEASDLALSNAHALQYSPLNAVVGGWVNFTRAVQFQGASPNQTVVWCDDPDNLRPILHGLPIGTTIDGNCSTVRFLPEAMIEFVTPFSDQYVSWDRPLRVRARASVVPTTGGFSVGFVAQSGGLTLTSNVSSFYFPPGQIQSSVVELYVKERNVAPNTIGTLALAASPYLLLTWSGSVVEFAIRPSTSVFSNATAGIPFLLELDQLRPTFSILPADPAQEGSAPSFAADLSVEFTFPRLNEVAPDGSVLQSAVLEGQWQAATANNATQKFVLEVVGLFNNTATKVAATISLFDRPGFALFANITLALRPELAKLSLAITGWPWLSPDNHLEVAIAVHPPFASATSLNTTANMTTFELRGQHGGQVDATIRVLDAAEFTSNTTTTIVTTASFINTAASELVLRFPYFGNATLIHDPDFGLFLKGKKGSTGDDDQTWVIAVAVAVPVAVAVVVAVVAVAVLAAWVRKRRMRAGRGSVNFSSTDGFAPANNEEL